MAKNNGVQATGMTSQARNALRVVTVTLGFAVATDILCFALALRTGAWQLFAWGIDVFGLVVVLLASIWLIRRGRSVSAIWLMLGGLAVVVSLTMLWIVGLGLALGLCCVTAISLMAIQMLSPRQTGWGFIASVAVGAAVLLLDVFGSADRLAAPPEMMSLLSVITVLAMFVLGFLLVRHFVNYTLHTKLVIVLLVVVLTSVGLLAFLNNRATRLALTDDANQALFAAASQTATNIDAFINTNLDVIRTEAQLPLWSTYLKLVADQKSDSRIEAEVRATLRALSRKTNISSYALLDGQGRDVMDTFASHIGTDKSGRKYFQEPLKSGLPYASPVEFSPTTGKPSLYFSSPVRGSAGHIVGILRMRYDTTVLQTLVVQSNGLAGPDSFAVLFDEYHIRLAHGTAPETVLQAVAPLDPARLADLQAVHRLPDLPAEELSTDSPALEQNLTKAAGQPYFAVEDAAISGRMNQAAVTTLKTQPWLVAFFQPQDVFLAPVGAQERRAVLLAVVIAAVVVGAALGMAQLLAGPIIRLTAVAASVSAGDLTARARVESGDEIGTLATTFNSMTEQLHGLISGLEQRVADRTRDLERRTHYLEATAEVAREAVSVLDLHELLSRVTALISERFGFYHTGLFLLDPSGEWAVLQAASSEGGQRMLARGHQLRVGQKGIVGYVTGRGEPRIALDVGADAVFFDNPDLPDTRSEMALPLRARGEIIGALDVQSKEPEAFSGEDVAVLETLADQVAMAISNARLFQQAEEGLEAERRAYGELSRQAWDEMLRARPDLGYRYDEEGVVPLAGHPSPGERRGDDSERGSEPVKELPELALPVRVRGRVIGTINAHKPSGAAEWTAEEVALMETLTDQLGVALESARLYQDTQRRAARERLTGEVTARMRETLDMETVLKTAVQEVRQALGLPEVVIRLASQPIGQAGDDVETK